MKFLITAVKPITSKKGDKYVVVHGIAGDGETSQVWLNAQQMDDFRSNDLSVMSPEELEEVFKTYKLVDIEFNQRGRVENIENQ